MRSRSSAGIVPRGPLIRRDSVLRFELRRLRVRAAWRCAPRARILTRSSRRSSGAWSRAFSPNGSSARDAAGRRARRRLADEDGLARPACDERSGAPVHHRAGHSRPLVPGLDRPERGPRGAGDPAGGPRPLQRELARRGRQWPVGLAGSSPSTTRPARHPRGPPARRSPSTEREARPDQALLSGISSGACSSRRATGSPSWRAGNAHPVSRDVLRDAARHRRRGCEGKRNEHPLWKPTQSRRAARARWPAGS